MLSLLLFIALPHPAIAQNDPFTCQPPQTIGVLAGLNDPTSMTIDGDYAYIIEQNQTLVIIDLSDHTAPQLLSRTPIPLDECDRISINGDAAYLSHNSSEWFTIFNIADKTNPWFVRQFIAGTSDGQYSAFSPTHIFQKSFAINITDPFEPTIDNYTDPDFQFDDNIVAVHDNTAIAANLEQYDITDPLNPILLDIRTFGDVDDQNTRFEYPNIISLSTTDGIVSFADINAPAYILRPTEVQTLGFTDAVVRGNLLFVANDSIDVYAVSYSSILSPLLVASFGSDHGIDDARLIRRHGDHFVAIGFNDLAIYDIHTNPIGGTFAGQDSSFLDMKGNIAAVGSHWSASNPEGVTIVDISDLEQPQWIAQIRINIGALSSGGFAFFEDHLFVASRLTQLHDFDLSNPEAPVLNALYDTVADPKSSSDARDVKINGNIAYVIDRNAGLTTYQIQSDATLVPLANLPIDDRCQSLTLLDDLAFICSNNRSYIIQIDNPANPQLLSVIEGIAEYAPYQRIFTAHRDGDLLYTVDYAAGYRIFDISDPADPIELAHFEADVITPQGEFLAYAFDILVEDDLLYLAMGSGGFAIYDNTNPFDPTLITHIPATVQPAGTGYRQFVKQDDMIYLASRDAGLRILSLDGCTGPCPTDLNNDGVLNFFDVSAFIIAFTNEDPLADFNNDGQFNFFDVSDFIVAFSNGCP